MLIRDDFTGIGTSSLQTRIPWSRKSGAIIGASPGDRVRTAATPDSVYRYDGASFDGNQYAECVVSWVGGGSGQIGPAVRLSASGSGYGALVNEVGGVLVGFFSNGSLFGSNGSGTVSSGDLIRLSVIGNTFRLYANGIEVFNFNDSALPPFGKTGLAASGDSVTLFADDWSSYSSEDPSTIMRGGDLYL